MSTTLANCRILLSKQMGDYWASTTTSAGAADYTTIVDTALKAKADAWITDECFTLITEVDDSSEDDERKIIRLDSNAGALTTLPHTAQIATATDYEVHRLFTASEKRIALIHAAKAGYPYIFKEIKDETKTLGNWLRNACFTEWASSSYPDYWRVSTIASAVNTDALYSKRGATGCKLTRAGTTGYLYTSEDYVYDFKGLYDKSVTFSKYVFAASANQVRLAIYDGTTTTYSDYNTQTNTLEELEVKATIQEYPTAIEFRTYIEVDGDVYVSDARVTDPTRRKIYIGDLGLAQNKPHQVLRESSDYSQREPWVLIHNYEVDKDGYLYLPTAIGDYKLRILGIGYLDFVDSNGDSSTAWDATIDIDSPQTEILVAEAAIYLCNQMIVPNETSGESERWMQALGYWKAELRDRQGKYGMQSPNATIHWR